MDGYSINIKVISPRTTNSWARDEYVLVGPSFNGSLPNKFDEDHIIRCLTRFVLVAIRTALFNSHDVPNVKAIQKGYTISSLNGLKLKKTNVPVFPWISREEVAKHSPEPQVFFTYANFIINYMAIEDYESDLFRRFAKIDVGPSMNFVGQEMSPEMYKDIRDGITNGSDILDHGNNTTIVVNGWRLPYSQPKIVHSDYFTRAYVLRLGGLYGNAPAEAIYRVSRQDIDGNVLDSSNKYTLTFATGQFPPVNSGGFWSATIYDHLGLPVHNTIDRYLIGIYSQGLKYDDIGALTLYIQRKKPDDKAISANWLPAPDPEFDAERGYEIGAFEIIMRIYWPTQAALDGPYFPPAVRKAGNSN